MTLRRTLVVFATALATQCVAANVWAQAALLGIPFGEQLQLAQCPANTDKAKVPCWIDKPFLYKPTGSKSGYVHLPNSKDRPDWAAHAMFQIIQDKDGRVQELKVQTFSSKNRIQIAESISMRFGKPYEDELRRSDVAWAAWRSPQGHVEMRCKDECWTEFRTPTAQAELESELAERAKQNATRPKAP